MQNVEDNMELQVLSLSKELSFNLRVAGFSHYQSIPGKAANKNKLKSIAGADFWTIGWQVLKLSCTPVSQTLRFFQYLNAP